MRYLLTQRSGDDIAVEQDRLVDAKGSFDLRIDLAGGDLRAGLINAHDHLHRNHYPRLGRPPYSDSYAWGRDIHERDAEVIERARRVDRRDALLFGALKNLISGVTTVVHHDPWEKDFELDFPLRVARVRTLHSLGIERDRIAAVWHDRDTPLCIHLAEGTTPEIADEVRDAERLGLLDEPLLAVHAIGVDADGIDRLIRQRVIVVWCPTSNEWLFHRTAPRELISGARVVIGSDSLLTAEGTLLDEVRHARATGLLDDERLLQGVSSLAAEALGLSEPVLTPGASADFVLLKRPVLDATTEDVELVVVGGVPRLGAPRFSTFFDRMGIPYEPLHVGRAIKLVAAPLASIAARIVAQWPEGARIFGTSRDRATRGD